MATVLALIICLSMLAFMGCFFLGLSLDGRAPRKRPIKESTSQRGRYTATQR